MAEEGLLGGLLRGIAQGMQINLRRRRDDEELKLKKKLADAQNELDQIRIGKEQEASVERGARRGREQSRCRAVRLRSGRPAMSLWGKPWICPSQQLPGGNRRQEAPNSDRC